MNKLATMPLIYIIKHLITYKEVFKIYFSFN